MDKDIVDATKFLADEFLQAAWSSARHQAEATCAASKKDKSAARYAQEQAKARAVVAKHYAVALNAVLTTAADLDEETHEAIAAIVEEATKKAAKLKFEVSK